jgi:hypothetical protein
LERAPFIRDHVEVRVRSTRKEEPMLTMLTDQLAAGCSRAILGGSAGA